MSLKLLLFSLLLLPGIVLGANRGSSAVRVIYKNCVSETVRIRFAPSNAGNKQSFVLRLGEGSFETDRWNETMFIEQLSTGLGGGWNQVGNSQGPPTVRQDIFVTVHYQNDGVTPMLTAWHFTPKNYENIDAWAIFWSGFWKMSLVCIAFLCVRFLKNLRPGGGNFEV